MFEVPSDDTIREILVDDKCVTEHAYPAIIRTDEKIA
jgi:hypothetical protein